MKVVVFYFIFAISLGFIFLQFFDSQQVHTYLEHSVPYVGGKVPQDLGIFGNGVTVAVIDTGVDFNHPDLFGWGPDGKVIGGYNFIDENELPLDTNGHGTEVAGVIAADGQVKGMAPKAKILAYKVSENGEGVSSDLIVKAIEKAIDDKADIINISLGVNKTNTRIDKAVIEALQKEIFVVTAAGNDGPYNKTIGSPGRNHNSMTIGATYNNLTSSLVATLEVDDKPYTVIPMEGSSKIEKPIVGKIVFGGYGKADELKDIDAKDNILLVERGSDVEGEKLYFSIKEKNAADAGAKALIVYNNEPGIYLGKLIHEDVESDYTPRIPVVSMDRNDGLEIKETKNGNAILNLFYNPDFVAHFSSRGPVSPFYIKPDMVAPGAYINTTMNNGKYNFTSGTSYAAPHVSGAAALLLEKYPQIHHHEIKSLLMTTSEPVSDAYGNEFSVNDAGSGRLNIAKAFEANLLIYPPNFVMSLSSVNQSGQVIFDVKTLDGTPIGDYDISYVGPEFVKYDTALDGNNLNLQLEVTGEEYGDYEGKFFITHQGIRYVVPFVLHYTIGSVTATQDNGKLDFEIYHPEKWKFAKISITNSDNLSTDVTTASPDKDASIQVYQNGEYWIEAKINVNGETFEAYNTITVDSVTKQPTQLDLLRIPEKQIEIIAVIVAAIGIVGLVLRKNSTMKV